ncbi:HPr family phosphocarrier protein [Pontiella desulfatans]|uniref:HPr family phosphocarrier protein n=1 Tax=Pontiella desulfatans TaxID=2750659 RepID=UPI001443BAEF|nr:HPr family phosphocarrier protein [Pontiella desulfatans]
MDTHSQIVRINSRFGLHMRPAAEISKVASNFDAIVVFYKGVRIAHAHSVVEMLMLGAFHGDELKMTSVGSDAKEALKAIADLLADYSDDQSPQDIDSEAA